MADHRTGDQAVRDALSVPAEEREITVEGTTIRYRYWTGPEEGGGAPVLLVHGMLAHARWWDAVAGWLQEERPVAALDLSGMGDSGRREKYDRQTNALEIGGVLRDVGFEGACVIAHSYGGDPTLRCCLDNPGLMSRIVLLDSRLLLPGVLRYNLKKEPAPEKRKLYPSFEAARERFRLTPESLYPNPVMFDHIAMHSIEDIGEGWTWKFDKRVGMEGEPANRLDPRSLTLPITFIRGGESDVTSPDQIAITREYLPRARFLELPGAGHHLMIDQPLALTAMLRGLLSND